MNVRKNRATTARSRAARTRSKVAAKQPRAKSAAYRYRYTTGPFQLQNEAGSLDWVLLNNDATPQKVRVTVFQCPLDGAKTPMPPGPLELTLAAGFATHNANTYTPGLLYEVVLECNSQRVFPYVSAWRLNTNDPLPGSIVNAGSFLRLMP